MKKLLESFRGKGEKTKLKKADPSAASEKIADPLARSSLFTKKNSVRRRPATASRIPVEYPTPPDALQPLGDLPALPGIDGLPSLMESTSTIGAYDRQDDVDIGELGILDFGSFELPKERALPSVRQNVFVSKSMGYEHVEVQDNTLGDSYGSAARAGALPSPGIDLNAAVQLMESLRRTASPEELATLQNALNPNSPPSPTKSIPIATAAHQRPMSTRIASHVAQLEGVGPVSQPTSPTWKTDILVTSPLGKLEHLTDDLNPPRFPRQMQDARSSTPVDLDHSHLGSLNFGSLAITNGAPASPAPKPRKSLERQVQEIRVNSQNSDIRTDEFFTPDEYRRAWIEDDEISQATRAGHPKSLVSPNQVRGESPLKREIHASSQETTVEVEQLPELHTVNHLPMTVHEPIVKMAELINTDDETLDLEEDNSKISGIYGHSRAGSTQSRVSLADQYLADIPASPFEVDSPTPDVGVFTGGLDHEIKAIDHPAKMTASEVHPQPPTPVSTRPVDIPEIPGRKPSINSRPSQAQSDDSGYSSASASHHAHDAIFDSDSGALTTSSSFVAGNSSTPLDVSLISSIDTDGLDQSFASYSKDQDSPVSRELQMEYDNYQSPIVSTYQDLPRPLSPASTGFPHLTPPAQPEKWGGPNARPKSHNGSYFAATTSGSTLQRPSSSKFLQKPYEPGRVDASKTILNKSPNTKDTTPSKSVFSFGSESTKRVKGERRKSIKNVWGLLRSSDNSKTENTNIKSSLGIDNQSTLSVVSIKSYGDSKTSKKLQKKKNQRPISSYAGAARSEASLVPAVPTDLQKRFTEREVYVDISIPTKPPTTIGVPYEMTERSKTPMMQIPSPIDASKRQLPVPPAQDDPQVSTSIPAERRFSLGRLASIRPKSSTNLLDETTPEGRPSDETLDDSDFPKGYMASIPSQSDPALGRSPYDLPTMHVQNPNEAPKVQQIPGRHLPQGYGRPPNQWGGPGPRNFRPPGPGGPAPQSGRGRPMSYHGRAPPPRRRMEVVGERDEDGHSSDAMADHGLLDVGDSLTMSRSPSDTSVRVLSNGTVVRPKSAMILAGTLPSMDSPPLGYGGLARPNGGYGYPPMRVSSSSSIKRMSMPVSTSVQHWKSQPDLREEANRSPRYFQNLRSPRIDENGSEYFDMPSRSPRLNAISGFHGPPPISPQPGNRNTVHGSLPPPRSPRLGDVDFLQRPVSRSSSIMSGRSTSTAAGPRPYPGPGKGPKPQRNSLMMLDSLGSTVGSGPYPVHLRQASPQNPYQYAPRSSPRMTDGSFSPMQGPPRQRPKPMSTMMMDMSMMDMGGPYPYPQNQNNGPGGWGIRPMSGHSMRSTSGLSQRSVSGNAPRPVSRDMLRPMVGSGFDGGYGMDNDPSKAVIRDV